MLMVVGLSVFFVGLETPAGNFLLREGIIMIFSLLFPPDPVFIITISQQQIQFARILEVSALFGTSFFGYKSEV